MIIECPACATRYEVPDAAIGEGGRKVRCAKCRHSWHATAIADDGDEGADFARGDGQATDGPFEADGADRAGTAGNEAGWPDAGEAVAPAVDEPAAGAFVAQTVPQGGEGWRDAAVSPDFRTAPEDTLVQAAPAAPLEDAVVPRPGRRRFWALTVLFLVVMVVAAVLAILLWGPPAWMPGRTNDFALDAPAELVLDFPREQQGPRQLPNGTEIFGASGTITNQGDTTRRVPPILIVLRDSHERVVYSWEVAPPKRSLAPGETVAVNEAVTDAPRSAQFADIGWKPG